MDKSDIRAYRVRTAETAEDLKAAQRLRWRAFRPQGQAAGGREGLDRDRFDALCRHVLIEERATGRLVCCFRVLDLGNGRDLGKSYAAQFYGLSGLDGYPGRMAEIGRFCLDSRVHDSDVLRLAWSVIANHVEAAGVEMLFGCSSFKGTRTARYLDAFAMLKHQHLAPKRWLPQVKAPDVFRFARRLRRAPDPRRAALTMPPLLRSYLAMGGWVSDHAVVDRHMGTLHVFTGLEIAAIPPARVRFLRGGA